MTDTQPLIASAVVVPDQHSPSPTPRSASPPVSHKRRQSSVSDGGNKRARLSEDKGESRDQENVTSRGEQEQGRRAAGRRTGQAEERKRGQRLFGALLGTLSQSSTSAAQKRREIERRQQAKIKQQEEEDDEKTQQKLEELRETRRKEQWKFDRDSMRIQQSNTMAMANFLQTRTEPKLYYRPWDLLPDEEDQIKKQIADAEALINDELDDERDTAEDNQGKQDSNEDPEADSTSKQLQGENGIAMISEEPGDNPPIRPEQARPESAEAAPESMDISKNGKSEHVDDQNGIGQTDGAADEKVPEAEDDAHGDDNGEEVLEAEEDTVLY